MKAKITFKRQNPEFDKEYAEQYHHGDESDENQKDVWSITWGITKDVIEYIKKENTNFQIGGCSIDNVTVFEYVRESGESTLFSVSTVLLNKIHYVENANYDSSHLYVYLKDTDNFYVIDEVNYTTCEDCPPELKKHLVTS